MMTALILILLLVIMFLILYIFNLPDEEYTDYHENPYQENYDEGNSGENIDDNISDHDGAGDDDDGGDDGGGGDGGDGDDGEDEPGEGEGKKSAVLVSLVDAETGKAIQEKGVTFELYSDSNALMALNTYYPNKKRYTKYSTRKDGSFYLPEKILETSYYLHQLSELQGYDLTDKTEFKIDDTYDWPDPFLVKVKMYPKRDVIRIQMTDKQTGKAVAGGEFEVIAAEDIVTQDDTVRVKKGERATTIVCDENGYGESSRLYLGKYTVRQSKIPEYYANSDTDIKVTLEDKRAAEEKKEKENKGKLPTQEEQEEQEEEEEDYINVNAVRAERTKITFVLEDELEGTAIAGAEFNVTGPDLNENMTTDENGEIILDSVKKNGTYEFSQISAPGDYIAQVEPVKVEVSAEGRIGKKAQTDVIATNRIIRLDIGVVDAVLQNHLVDIKAELFAESGKLIKSWTTNGAYAEFTGLPEGEYYVTLNGKESKKYSVNVTNTAQLQQFNIRLFTSRSYTVIGGASILLAAILLLLIILIRKGMKKRAQKKAQERAEERAQERAEEMKKQEAEKAGQNDAKKDE